MKNLCVILARGGSKGLPDKNIRDFCGKPLIAHSISAALESGVFNDVVVSSDSDRILQISAKYGAEIIIRPAELASDSAKSIDALIHAIVESESRFAVNYDNIILLQPTSPLRNAEDIKQAYELYCERKCPSLFSVFKPHASPYFNMVELASDGRVEISKPLKDGVSRRQDAPEVYQINGAIYIWKKTELMTHLKLIFDDSAIYIMPEERSWDIDNILDFEIAEFLYRR